MKWRGSLVHLYYIRGNLLFGHIKSSWIQIQEKLHLPKFTIKSKSLLKLVNFEQQNQNLSSLKWKKNVTDLHQSTLRTLFGRFAWYNLQPYFPVRNNVYCINILSVRITCPCVYQWNGFTLPLPISPAIQLLVREMFVPMWSRRVEIDGRLDTTETKIPLSRKMTTDTA